MNFRKGKEIGRGGFGIVYEAVGDDGKEYALKFLNSAALPDQDTLRRFEREVRYQQMVDHPNVVPVVAADLTVNPPCVDFH
jgi:eukaryotic-like serine/threonine-protein kinase